MGKISILYDLLITTFTSTVWHKFLITRSVKFYHISSFIDLGLNLGYECKFLCHDQNIGFEDGFIFRIAMTRRMDKVFRHISFIVLCFSWRFRSRCNNIHSKKISFQKLQTWGWNSKFWINVYVLEMSFIDGKKYFN